MANIQRVKYFPHIDPEAHNRSSEERVNEFLSKQSINALNVSMDSNGILLLYEES